MAIAEDRTLTVTTTYARRPFARPLTAVMCIVVYETQRPGVEGIYYLFLFLVPRCAYVIPLLQPNHVVFFDVWN